MTTLSNPSTRSRSSDLLWAISGPNCAGTTYLFGTLHLDCRPPWLKSVVDLLGHVNWLAQEIDLSADETVPPWVGPASRDAVGPRWPRIARAALRSGIPLRVAGALPPMDLWARFVIATYEESRGMCVDAILFLAAISKDMEIRGLETRVEVREALLSLPIHAQVDALLYAADGVLEDKLRREGIAELCAAYTSGHVHPALRTLRGWHTPVFRRTLVDARNARFVERLVAMSAVSPGLVAVGMSHLHGRGGMVARLRAAGLSVRRVPLR